MKRFDMSRWLQLVNLSLVVVVSLCQILTCKPVLADDYFQGPGASAADILRGRGFLADEFFIQTTSGYVLRITRGRNPLLPGGHLNSKAPILFVHGILATANNWLLDSRGAAPKNLTGMDFRAMNLDQAQQALAGEPSAKVLPLLASNRGHEVWLLDRAGRPGSQELRGDPLSIRATPSSGGSSQNESIWGPLQSSNLQRARQVAFSADVKFWNFSLDLQASNHFPQVVDFVLANSPYATRVSLVTHSAGGAIALMAMSLYPGDLSQKLASTIFWSPAYAAGNGLTAQPLYEPFVAIEESFIGPLPAPFETEPIQVGAMQICTPPPAWTTICEGFTDVLFGFSGLQQPVRPEIVAGFPYSTSSQELAQVRQPARFPPNRTMHYYDYGAAGNLTQYGQTTPPAYDLSVLINFTAISFYVGATDALVRPEDVTMTRNQLRVPSRYHLINTTFNHIGYFNHIFSPKFAIIPTQYEIETMFEFTT